MRITNFSILGIDVTRIVAYSAIGSSKIIILMFNVFITCVFLCLFGHFYIYVLKSGVTYIVSDYLLQ